MLAPSAVGTGTLARPIYVFCSFESRVSPVPYEVELWWCVCVAFLLFTLSCSLGLCFPHISPDSP